MNHDNLMKIYSIVDQYVEKIRKKDQAGGCSSVMEISVANKEIGARQLMSMIYKEYKNGGFDE